jgi:D-alanyl-D-alanine carboxypeptidase
METERLQQIHRELGVSRALLTPRRLPFFPEARDLVVVTAGDQTHRLTPAAAAAWQRLQSAAAVDAVCLWLVSAFRGIEYQAELWRRKRAAGQTPADILRVNAPPGYSEHHTGEAIDIATDGSEPLTETFAQTPAFRWLDENAVRFGFRLSYPSGNPHGFAYEPWHWRFHHGACAAVKG